MAVGLGEGGAGWESAAEVAHFGFWGGGAPGEESGAFVAVAVGAGAPDFRDEIGEGEVGGAGAEVAEDVVAEGGEEAGMEFAVGGEAGAVAVAAEGLRDGRDEADLGGAVAVAVARGDFTAIGGADGVEGPTGGEAVADLDGGHDGGVVPVIGLPDVHELDEAQGEALVAGPSGEGFDLGVVDAALHDHVELHGEAGGTGGGDAGEDALGGEVAAVQAGGDGGVEGVEGNVDAIEAGGGEGGGGAGEEPAVGGESDVAKAEVVFEDGDEVGYICAEEGLAAGKTDFFDAEGNEGGGDARDLGGRHELRVAEKGVARAEDLGGHAVGAPEITPVGDRDAEVAQGALEGVAEIAQAAKLRAGVGDVQRATCFLRRRGGSVLVSGAMSSKLPTPTEAAARILAALPVLPTEDCPLAAAHGRVLRRALVADRALPPYDRVTMDGYAVAAGVAGERRLRVVGMQAAGMMAKNLVEPAETCLEVATGAVLPVGADAVVPYELVTRAGDEVVLPENVAAALAPGQNVHRRGSDGAVGAAIGAAGRRLGGAEIGAAAACGYAQVNVSWRPQVVVIATGDELVEVETPQVAAHQVRKSNDYALRAALLRHGVVGTVERRHVRDHRPDIERGLREALAGFDVVVLTGGVSQGKFDFVPTVLAELQVRPLVHGVAQRPGKPLWVGLSSRQVPVFALPGNPVSALTCLHRYVLPALEQMVGLVATAGATVRLATEVKFGAPLAYLLPVRVALEADGVARAWPQPFNTSGDLGGMVGTTGFVELPYEVDAVGGAGRVFPVDTLASYRVWY